MKKVCDFFKNHQIAIIITGVILAILIIGLILTFVLFDKEEKEPNVNNESKVEEKLIAPALNTETLLEKLIEVKVKKVATDEIAFSDDVELEEGEKVAIWLYSEPKFLGYFEVVIKDGVKKIEGLEKALANIEVEKGKHNIAIVKEDGNEIGYVNVYINDDGLNENEIKEVTEKETIKYQTTKQEEVNMKNGTKEVVQAGKNGEKTVKYKVTYDVKGKEIDREKVSEKVTEEPIEEIIKVGISDWNINTDKMTESSFGTGCTENELIKEEDGYFECQNANTNFNAVKINSTYYITSFKDNGTEKITTPVKVDETINYHLIATIKGTKYYFYKSAGEGMEEALTQEKCAEYKLSCGAW